MPKYSLRTCVACRTIRKKENLIRLIVDENNQVIIDPTGKTPDRGVYVCNNECLVKAIEENALSRAFRKKVKAEKLQSQD